MGINALGADYGKLRAIFDDFLVRTLDWIIADAEHVVKQIDQFQWTEADGHFGQSFLALWYMFENKIWLGREREPAKLLRSADPVFGENPPFLKVLTKKLGKGDFPGRPTISGFLTELYVYFFLQRLLKGGKGNRSTKVQFGGCEPQIKKLLGFDPDIVVSLSGKNRVIVEVKTNGQALFRKWQKRHWRERREYRRFGPNICPWIEERDRWHEVSEKGLEFLLFCGEPGSNFQVLEDDKDYGLWIYVPGSNRLEPITKRIRQAVSH